MLMFTPIQTYREDGMVVRFKDDTGCVYIYGIEQEWNSHV